MSDGVHCENHPERRIQPPSLVLCAECLKTARVEAAEPQDVVWEKLKPGDPGGIAGLTPRFYIRVSTAIRVSTEGSEGSDGLEFGYKHVVGWTIEHHGVLSLTFADGRVELFSARHWLRVTIDRENP